MPQGAAATPALARSDHHQAHPNTMRKKTEPGPRSAIIPPTPPKINVRATRLRLAATCIADLDIRYYLCGVYIEPREDGGVFIVATDGHRMMAVIDEMGSASAPTIIRLPGQFLKALPRPCTYPGGEKIPGVTKGSRSIVASSIDNCRVTIEELANGHALMLTDGYGRPSHVQPGNPIIEGKFPDWRRVLPSFQKLVPGTNKPWNFNYLLSVVSVFKSDRYKLAVGTRPYHQPDNNGAAFVFHLVGHEYACLLIMPMLGDGERVYQEHLDKLMKNWGDDARRPAKPAEAQTENLVAIPTYGGIPQEGGAPQADAERPAAEAKADPAKKGPKR